MLGLWQVSINIWGICNSGGDAPCWNTATDKPPSIWFIYFILSIQEVVVRSLNPFVVSDFAAHSLTAVVGIISSLFSGLAKIVFAKLMDTWGRPQTLLITMLLWTVGFIMMAACKNVETYAAAQVFYLTGYATNLPMTLSETDNHLQRPGRELLYHRLHF